jgi:hypothetical protein
MEEEELLPPPPKKSQAPVAEEEELLPPPPKKGPTAGETAAHSLGIFNKVITDVPQQMLQGAGVATNWAGNKLKDATNAVGLTDYADSPVEDNPLYQLGKGVEEVKSNTIDGVPDPRLQDSFWATDIPQGLGSVAAVMLSQGRSLFKALPLKAAASGSAAGVKEALTGVGKSLTSRGGTTGSVMMAVPEYDAAIESGLSESDAFNVFLKNYLIGGTEVLPIEKTLGFINQATGGMIMRAIKSGAVGSIEEGVQEGIQTYLANRVAQGSYDPERNEYDGVARSMLAGFVIGGGLGGVGGAASRRAKPTPEAVAVHEADKAVATDPSVSTGDEQTDAEIDMEYADIAAKLDAIVIEETPEESEDAVEDMAAENVVEDDQELMPTIEYDAEPEPTRNEREIMLAADNQEMNTRRTAHQLMNMKLNYLPILPGGLLKNRQRVKLRNLLNNLFKKLSLMIANQHLSYRPVKPSFYRLPQNDQSKTFSRPLELTLIPVKLQDSRKK